MKKSNRILRPSPAFPEGMEFEANPPRDYREVVAVVAGIASSFAVILGNIVRLESPDNPYPITNEEREFLIDMLYMHTGSLEELLAKETDGPHVLEGQNHWSMEFGQHGVGVVYGSYTEFTVAVASDDDDAPLPPLAE